MMFAAILLVSAMGIPQNEPQLSMARLSPTRDVRLQTGPWRAWLECQGGELPFGLELQTEPLSAWIINGEERIALPRIEIADGVLTLGIDYYDTKIIAQIEDDGRSLRGTWHKRPNTKFSATMPFRAIAGRGPRFLSKAPAIRAANIDGRWAVDFDGDRYPAVGIFRTMPDGRIDGTFLTALGDYRYLSGNLEGNRLPPLLL